MERPQGLFLIFLFFVGIVTGSPAHGRIQIRGGHYSPPEDVVSFETDCKCNRDEEMTVSVSRFHNNKTYLGVWSRNNAFRLIRIVYQDWKVYWVDLTSCLTIQSPTAMVKSLTTPTSPLSNSKLTKNAVFTLQKVPQKYQRWAWSWNSNGFVLGQL